MRAEAYLDEKTLPSQLQDWLADLGPGRFQLSPHRCALLLVDVQNVFAHPDGRSYLPAASAIMPNVLALLHAWRRAGECVAFTRHCHRRDERSGSLMSFWGSTIDCRSRGSQLLDELNPACGEPVFRKSTYDAFHRTGLEDWLRRKDRDQVLVAGLLTHLCVETTVRSAFVRDYQPFVAADATATVSRDIHFASLRSMHHGFATVMASAAAVRALDVRG